MVKLSQIPAPAIAGVVREKTKGAAIGEIKNCRYDGADMIDLHMSCLDSYEIDNLKAIIDASTVPVLALNYNTTCEGIDAGFSEEKRVESFYNAVHAGAAGIDMQGYTFHLPSKSGFYGEDKYSFTKGNPKEIITDHEIISKQCELIDQVHYMGAEVLLSCHPGIPMNSTQVVELALFLEKRNPDIIKIVTVASDEDDVMESIQTMLLLKKEVKTPISYHVNGKFGGLSRIINPVLGGQIAFCVDRYSESYDKEQLNLKTARIVVDNIRKLTMY